MTPFLGSQQEVPTVILMGEGSHPSRIKTTGDDEAAGRKGNRQWSKLPDLALHAIATRLNSPTDFFAFSGVCKHWRAAASSEMTIARFISSLPPLILLHPSSFYSVKDDVVYYLPLPQTFAVPRLSGCLSCGQTNGHLFCFNSVYDEIASIVNPLTLSRIDFDAMHDACYRFSILSEPSTTSPNCFLLIFLEHYFSCINVETSELIVHEYPSVRDAIFFHGRLYVTRFCFVELDGSAFVRVLEYDLEKMKIKREVTCCREGFLMVSSEEELLMVYWTADWRLVGAKLAPGMVEETDAGDLVIINWPRPREQCLFIGWQRSDFSTCTFPSMGERWRKRYRIDIRRQFWSIFLDGSKPLHCNGFYLFVDDHGRADLSMIRPAAFWTDGPLVTLGR